MKLDAVLISMYDKRKREEEGTPMPRAEMFDLFVSRLQAFTRLCITRGGKTEEARTAAPYPPAPPRNTAVTSVASAPLPSPPPRGGLSAFKLKICTQYKPSQVVKKGGVKNMHLQVEERQAGRKFITKVAGMEYFGIDPEELSASAQKKYNTSASVQDLPGKSETGKEVQIQGNLLAEMLAYLESKYGITAAYVDVVSKLKS